MANGDYLSPEELRKYIKPIEEAKEDINKFAGAKNIDVFYYSRGWPHVELIWKNSYGLDCLIQLYMDDDKTTFILWIAATKDIDRNRYMKDIKLHSGLMPPFDVEFIIGEMRRGFDLCNSWQLDDLSLVKRP